MPTSPTNRPLVAVLGSVNVDTSLRVGALPTPGETVSAISSTEGPGGKGANQAAAVSRSGVRVTLLASVGDDAAGATAAEALNTYGVDTSRVVIQEGESTGRAYVMVDASGENSIVIYPGANAMTTKEYVTSVHDAIADATVLVVQGEVSADATGAAIRIADQNHTRVIANLAPYVELGDLTASADPLVLNSVEASQLTGHPIVDAHGVRRLAGALTERAKSVVVTLGAAGAILCTREGVLEVPAPAPAAVLDTTGAGDAFVGVMAAALASGFSLERACASAVAAATLTVENIGAAAGYPAFSLPGNPVGVRA